MSTGTTICNEAVAAGARALQVPTIEEEAVVRQSIVHFDASQSKGDWLDPYFQMLQLGLRGTEVNRNHLIPASFHDVISEILSVQGQAMALDYVLAKFDKLAESDGFAEIESLIASFDHRMPTSVLLGSLRYSYPYRDKLISWSSCVSRVAAELTSRGKDPRRLLSGLMDRDGSE